MSTQNPNSPEDVADVVERLIERIAHMTGLITQQQALISALLAYFREQPTWNPKRFAALLDEQRQELGLERLAETDAVLKALLATYRLPFQ